MGRASFEPVSFTVYRLDIGILKNLVADLECLLFEVCKFGINLIFIILIFDTLRFRFDINRFRLQLFLQSRLLIISLIKLGAVDTELLKFLVRYAGRLQQDGIGRNR